MRMLDDETDRPLKLVSIFLTPDEAREMRGYLDHLISDPAAQHSHLSDSDLSHEIIVSVYTDSLAGFHERAKRLILYDT